MSKYRSKIATLNSSERPRSKSQCINDKRKGELAVPLNLRSLLSPAQLDSVQHMDGFGWRLAFVRRSPCRRGAQGLEDAEQEPPMVVVKNDQESSFALLNQEGVIDTSADIKVRPSLVAEP